MFMILKQSIDFLNAFRMITQADSYHGGREILKAENSTVNYFLQDFFDIGFFGWWIYKYDLFNDE